MATMLTTAVLEELECGHCEKCYSKSPVAWLETHEYNCAHCWEQNHQCSYCGEFSKKEIQVAQDGWRYCDQCKQELFHELLDCVKRSSMICRMLGIISSHSDMKRKSVHATEKAFVEIAELFEFGETIQEPLDENQFPGVIKESIDLNGVEFFTLHDVKGA